MSHYSHGQRVASCIPQEAASLRVPIPDVGPAALTAVTPASHDSQACSTVATIKLITASLEVK
jgi:hypothetical protein